jgi:hypothetical protein
MHGHKEVDAMSDTTIVILVAVAAIVLIVLVGAVLMAQRRRALKDRFGPEYDRIEADRGPRAAAAELRNRERHFKELDIRPLDPSARSDYAMRWARVQEQFVDDPPGAVSEAGQLLTAVMTDRGYPVEDADYDQRLADLSVEHGRTLGRYRNADAVSRRARSDRASTEELRQAMVDYRALFEELLDGGAARRERVEEHAEDRGEDRADEHTERDVSPETTTDSDRRL